MNYSFVCAGLLGAAAAAFFWVIKSNFDVRGELQGLQAQMAVYVNALTEVNARQGEAADAMKKLAEASSRFEATGYTAKPLSDGRIEVSFLRRMGPSDPENPKKNEDTGEVRTVIMPAWMWGQVTAEAALRLGFDALDKAKEKKECEN